MFVYLVTMHIELHQGAHTSYSHNEKVAWSQSFALADADLPIIKNSYWRLDYVEIERLLWTFEFADTGELVISDALIPTLNKILFLLPKFDDIESWQRLSFVAQKSLQSKNGNHAIDLIKAYYDYQRAYEQAKHSLVNKEKANSLAFSEQEIVIRVQLQSEYFALRDAEKLFRKENLYFDYTYQRRHVLADTSLNVQRKKAKLAELMHNYQRSLNGQ